MDKVGGIPAPNLLWVPITVPLSQALPTRYPAFPATLRCAPRGCGIHPLHCWDGWLRGQTAGGRYGCWETRCARADTWDPLGTLLPQRCQQFSPTCQRCPSGL